MHTEWKTGNMQKKTHGGHHVTRKRNICALAKELTDDIARQVTNGNLDEAAALVEANLVGMRKGKSGAAALAASPDAQRILDEREILPIPPKWQTGSMRRGKFGGSHVDHNNNIIGLSNELINDIAIQVTNGNLDEATALVETFLIGLRQGKGGPPALAASPDAQRLLDDEAEKWKSRAKRISARDR